MTSDSIRAATPPGPYFDVIDGLRGVAALAVVGYHIPDVFGGGQTVPHGAVAVDFFFMLSGFVIACAYEAGLRSGRLAPHRLVLARLIRLMPLAMLGTLIGAASLIVGGALATPDAGFLGHLMLGIALLPAPWPAAFSDNILPLNWPSWSLFFELYVGTTLAIAASRLSNRMLAAVIATTALAFGAAAIRWDSADLGWAPATLNAGFARFGCTFLIGWLFWRLRIDTIAPKTHPAFVAVLLAAVLLVPSPDAWPPAYDLAAAMIACPLVLALGSACDARGGWRTASGWLGRLSYPIYALHAPILLLVGHYGGVSARIAAVPAVLLSATAALLLYDEPARRALSGLRVRARSDRPMFTRS